MKRGLILLCLASALGACTSTSSLYQWGSYPNALNSYTKTGDAAEFEQKLRETIEKGENKGEGQIPPGVYAELGYILMTNKQPAEALIFFENEKAAYPESAVLMDKMILGAKNASKEEEQDNAGRENGTTDQPAEEETSDAAS